MKKQTLISAISLACLMLLSPAVHAKKAKASASPDASPAAAMADASATPDASPAAKKRDGYPIHGKLKSVDLSANTFSLDAKTPRTYMLTPTTKIKKNGAPATLKDAVVGEDVGGYVKKTADGKIEVMTVRFGPKPGAMAKKPGSAMSPAPKQ